MLTRKIAGSFLTAILLCTSSSFAQESNEWVRGLRFGCDISRFSAETFQHGRKPIEFSFDTEVKQNLFSTLEIGVESATRKNDRLDYKSNGAYGRIGTDYNILKRAPLSNDIVFVGARYGFYTINQQTDWYMIPGSQMRDTTGSIPLRSLNGHWMEAVFGVKVELFKNFFLGSSIRTRILIYSKKDVNYPLYMPGFGNGARKANFGINYSVYYQIPLMKVRPKKIIENKGAAGSKK